MTPTGVDWAAVRAGYPPVLRRTYLDTACKGIPSAAAVAAIEAHTAFLRECPGASTTEDTLVLVQQAERARSAAAALVGAEAGEIALVPSTQAGMNAVADALPFREGDEVLAPDVEFVGTLLPWLALRRRGVAVRLVPHREGRVEIDDFAAAVGPRTRAIVVSSVQEINGYAVDLAALCALCRERGLWSIVDGVQHVGPLRFDVRETPVDALAVGGHKWLCAPFGMGFLYVNRELHPALAPSVHGYMTTNPPAEEWLTYLENPERLPTDALRHPTDARQLELAAIGTSLAAAGLAAALETLLELGPAAIAARTAQLVELTAQALLDAGARIQAPPGAFLAFRTSGSVDGERAAMRSLADSGIVASLRFTTGIGGIRVSPYFYNDESDVERLAAAVRSGAASA